MKHLFYFLFLEASDLEDIYFKKIKLSPVMSSEQLYWPK